MIGQKIRISMFAGAVLSASVFLSSSHAASVPFSTAISGDYLIISTDGRNASDPTKSVLISNFEIGANKAPVPSTDDFLTGGSSGGPTLLGAVPDIPSSGVFPVFQGVGGHGNVAITNPSDDFDADNTGIYADPDIGVQIAGSANSGRNQSDDSFFNDPNMFPNTFTSTGPTGVLGNLGGFGTFVGPGDAVQSTRVDWNNNAGVSFNVDHSNLLDELSDARSAINGLPITGVLDTSGGNGGQFDDSTTLSGPATLSISPLEGGGAFNPSSDSRNFRITLAPGLNVIEIDSGDNDILLSNSNLIVDGPEMSSVIFLFDDDNFLVSNSNIFLGDGGIGRNDVLFYTDQNSNDTIFSFSNTIINGAAFWSLGDGGGGITVSNGQGSTQFIADIVNLSNVRFTRWGFSPIPEPSAATLLITGLLFLVGRKRRG